MTDPNALVFTFGAISTAAIGLVFLFKWFADERNAYDLSWAAGFLVFSAAIGFAAVQYATGSMAAGMAGAVLFWIYAALMCHANLAFVDQLKWLHPLLSLCGLLGVGSFAFGFYDLRFGLAVFTLATAMLCLWTGWILRKLPRIGTFAAVVFVARALLVVFRPLFVDSPYLFAYSVASFTGSFVVGATLLTGSLMRSRDKLLASRNKLYAANADLMAHEAELQDSNSVLLDQARRLENLGADYAEALNRAERANRAKNSFISNMNHEFRTPLNAILGFSELIQMYAARDGFETIAEYSKYVHDGGHAMLRNVNRILEFVALDAGDREFARHPFDPKAAIHAEIAALAEIAVAKRLAINRLLEGAPEVWPGDEKAFRSVVDELLRNALKAAPETSTVTVTMRSDGKELMLQIGDQGPGLSEEFIETVGDAFNINEHVLHRGGAVQGVGLGLCMAARYAKLMGGALSFDRNRPTGTIARLIVSAA